jgi:spore coat protein U-like protein
MKHSLSKLGLLSSLLIAGTASAAVNCSMSATNISAIHRPDDGQHTDAYGAITLNCTRGDKESSIDYWVGIDGSHRWLTHQTGTETLTYQVSFKDDDDWDDADRAVSGELKFHAGSPVASVSLPYRFRILKSNIAKPPGLYTKSILVTQRFKRSGANLSAATLNPLVNILPACRLSRNPAPLVLNYTSFSDTAVTASSYFDVNCTKSTPYLMTLDATNGSLLGLNYSLMLSATGGTGNALAQTYSVVGTIPAHQSGTCASASCTRTETRTITISY